MTDPYGAPPPQPGQPGFPGPGQTGGPPPVGAPGPQGPGWYLAADGQWYPPQVVVEQKKSNTGLVVGIIVAVVVLFCLVPFLAILAVTFLGRSASVKFSAVGSSINMLPPLPWRSLVALTW